MLNAFPTSLQRFWYADQRNVRNIQIEKEEVMHEKHNQQDNENPTGGQVIDYTKRLRLESVRVCAN